MKKVCEWMNGFVIAVMLLIISGFSYAHAQTVTPSLKLGDKGQAVCELQELLKKEGIYSYPEITCFFGPVTEIAVKVYQAQKGIVLSGTPESTGYGIVGPKTRASLGLTFSYVPTSVVTPNVSTNISATGVVLYRDMAIGTKGSDVLYLQRFLNQLGFLVAVSGPGSKNQETDFFGPATQAALIKFQIAYGIPPVGKVGPITRAKISLLGNFSNGISTYNKKTVGPITMTAVSSGGGGGGGGQSSGSSNSGGTDNEEDPNEEEVITPDLVPGSGFSGATSQPDTEGDANETAAEEKAIARWTVVPYITINEDYYVGVVADHYNTIDRVEMSVDGGPWVEITGRKINPDTNVEEYYATMQIEDFSDGLHEIRAIAYPRHGVPRVLGGSVNVTSLQLGEHSMYINTNRDGTLSQDVVYVSPSGNDSTGDGTQGNPYQTLQQAGFALGGGVFDGDAGGGIMYLAAGDYNLGTYTFAKKFTSPTRYVTIQPAPGVARESVRIVSATTDGLRTDLVRFYNVTFAPNSGEEYVLRNTNNTGIAWLDNVLFTAQNWNDTSSFNWSLGWAGKFFTDVTVDYVRDTPISGTMARNVYIEYTTDALKNIPLVLNAEIVGANAHGTDLHADIYQSWNQNGTYENFYIQNVTATQDVESQGLFFHGFTTLFRDGAFRDINIDNTNNGVGTVFVNLHAHRPMQHVLFRDSTIIGCGTYRTGDNPATPNTSHNIFSAENMLMDNIYSDNNTTSVDDFCVPNPDGPAESIGDPGDWPGTLPWLSPLGVFYAQSVDGDFICEAPTVTSSASVSDVVDEAFSYTLTSSGSAPTYEITSGSLPSGLSLTDGEISGTPTVTGTYVITVTATNICGTDTHVITITILSQPPTVTLSASPSTIDEGETSVLTWSSTDATSCTASGGWSGSKSTSGSETTPALSENTVFTLTCTGENGSDSESKTVVVTPESSVAGLLAHYGLNGDVTDHEGSKNGIVVGTVAYAAGKSGDGLYIASTGNYVMASTTISGYPFTLAAWVKNGEGTIISLADADYTGSYYGLRMISGVPHLLARYNAGAEGDLAGSALDSNWHHIVGVFTSATDRKLYVDGALVGSQTTQKNWTPGVDTAILGVLKIVSPFGWFTGTMDEVKIFNVALSGAEVLSVYNELSN